MAATMVAAFPEVESLMVADLNLDAAQRVASACGDKAKAAGIDVTNPTELISFMRAADLVMNCVGPFFRFGVPVLKAAIAAGVDYLDICDDPEPTRAMHEYHGPGGEGRDYRYRRVGRQSRHNQPAGGAGQSRTGRS